MRTRTAIDNEVRDVVKTTETALKPEDVKELILRLDRRLQMDNARLAALATKSMSAITGPATVRRRMRQRIISDNELRTELDRAVLELLPPSPRAAKRMFNHAHLLLDIGVERGIFDTQPRLQPRQLAAWVALNELWPSVAASISSDPTLLERLEHAAEQAAQRPLRLDDLAAMESDLGITGIDASLLDYLRRSESLASCVRVLVNFSPDPDAGSEPETEPSAAKTGVSADPRIRQSSLETDPSSISWT